MIEIKAITLENLPAVIELDSVCFGGLWTAEGYQREIESDCSDLVGLFLIPDTGTESFLVGIGCLWAILEEAHITILGINPGYRRYGLGQVLLLRLLSYALGRKLERATLEVRVSNVAAIALYEKYGFKKAGCRKGYYPDGEDGLILWKSGLHHCEFPQILALWQQNIEQRLAEKGWFLKTD